MAPTRAPSPRLRHPESLVESSRIGPRTRIWAFAHVLSGATVGADCNICDHAFIEGGAVLGDRVTVKCGAQIWEGVTLEDDVFVGPQVAFTNDGFPRSRRPPAEYLKTLVRRGASVGANATILPGVTIGSEAMVGAGAVVTRNVPARAIVMGNPAVVTGYVDARRDPAGRLRARARGSPPAGPPGARAAASLPGNSPPDAALPGGARLYPLPRLSDARGHLSFAEVGGALPFEVARYFVIFGVPSREVRGEHAHRRLHQFLVCVHGQCSVRLLDGRECAAGEPASQEIRLDRPDLGLHIPPMVWTTQYKYSTDAVLLALASDVYREEDYLRDLDEYLELAAKPNARVGAAG